MIEQKALATASLENLYRIFTASQPAESTLAGIDNNIRDNLLGFLNENIAASDTSLEDIEKNFGDWQLPEEPQFLKDYTQFILENLVTHSVHTSAPGFIGHMTTPLPYFMLPLSRIMIALNQNPVKIETSKAFTPMERQVLGMLHQLVFQQDNDFYRSSLHNSEQALGSFCSGGTIANLTALWVARNRLFKPTKAFAGLAEEGIAAALQHIGATRLVVLVSERGHYSLGKAVDALGIGRRNLVKIPTDDNYRCDIAALRQICEQLAREGAKLLSIIGIAGTTEMGSVDPLTEMAAVARQHQAHFHVDAAWGGPTLFSGAHKNALAGIELADSVTIDAHKQMYVPMGAGMVLFKDPEALLSIQHHAQYILRTGSKDLGRYTLEGSRTGIAMLVHAALHIIGRTGYELLIDQNFSRAQHFAKLIEQHADFELITQPQLNILNYRYVPEAVQAKLQSTNQQRRKEINSVLDRVTSRLQKLQRAKGASFVSRTRFSNHAYNGEDISVFRAVIANPMTTEEVLDNVLQDQLNIAKDRIIQESLGTL